VQNDADLTLLIDTIRDGLQSLPLTAVYDRKAGPNNPVAIFPVSDLRPGLLTMSKNLARNGIPKSRETFSCKPLSGW